MKTAFIYCFIILVFITGCGKNKELYKETDAVVESLQTRYEGYGMFGGPSTTTKDGLYTVMPTGRLINVKIEKVASDAEYEDLRKDLEKHYKGDSRVNKVYICGGGTVMIDCRN